jgi:Trypsin-like peptidase domain
MPAVPYDPYRLPDYLFDQYVVPVLSEAGVHGTAFFINGGGVFLTARHVIEDARSAAAQSGGKIWLFVRIADSVAGRSLEILSTEFAPAPFDIAIGRVSAASQSLVRMANMSAGAPLSNVCTFGYPESAHARASSGVLRLGQRALWPERC